MIATNFIMTCRIGGRFRRPLLCLFKVVADRRKRFFSCMHLIATLRDEVYPEDKQYPVQQLLIFTSARLPLGRQQRSKNYLTRERSLSGTSSRHCGPTHLAKLLTLPMRSVPNEKALLIQLNSWVAKKQHKKAPLAKQTAQSI